MSLRVCFYASEKTRERVLADAFLHGVKECGDEGFSVPTTWEIPDPLPTCDVAVMVGVKSKRRFQAHWQAQSHTVMLDKGYVRGEVDGPLKLWKYWRVAIDGHHPTRYLENLAHDSKRYTRLGLKMHPWRASGEKIVFAGSSEKYHDFYDLEHPTKYAQKQIKRIYGLTDKPIVYRPKPSWGEAVPISGTRFGISGTIYDYLPNTHCLVTHGSNAVWEAVHAGVPTIVLGDAVSKPISSTSIEEILDPRLASMDERQKWAQALAWCQWTMAEFRSGEAWAHIKGELLRQCA